MLRRESRRLIGAIGLMAITASAGAQNKVVVVPLGGDDSPPTLISMRSSITSLRPYDTDGTSIVFVEGKARITSAGRVVTSLVGPMVSDGRRYRLAGVTYCLHTARLAGRFVDEVSIYATVVPNPGWARSFDPTDRTDFGCWEILWNGGDQEGYSFALTISGQTDVVEIASITSSWTREP